MSLQLLIMKTLTRKILVTGAERLVILAKRLQSAADRLVPSQRIYLKDCEDQGWRNVRPAFILSTGRSGTKLLTNILAISPNALPMHEPAPELYRPSRRAYEEIGQRPEVFREVFKSAREEYLLKALQQGRVYIETNNQITFFAPIIRDVFPNAVFIHLIRHPGDFVRSGIRRQWYSGNHSHDIGRIIPADARIAGEWNEWPPIKKMGWLWNETNQFIESFLATQNKADYITITAEALFSDPKVSRDIFNFLQIEGYHESQVNRIISKPVNAQRKGSFPKFEEWPATEKALLKAVVPLAAHYGYW